MNVSCFGRIRWALLAALFWAGLAPVIVSAQSTPTRGSLLYDTHCVACHRAQVHWRDQRVVKDWAGLIEQVRHWQSRAQLDWSDADIQEVARFLNRSVYNLPMPDSRG